MPNARYLGRIRGEALFALLLRRAVRVEVVEFAAERPCGNSGT